MFLGRRGAGLAAMVRSRSLALHSAQRAFERTHGNSYFLSSLVAPPPAGDASSNANCNDDEMELIEGTAVRVRGGRCCMTRFDSYPFNQWVEVGRVFLGYRDIASLFNRTRTCTYISIGGKRPPALPGPPHVQASSFFFVLDPRVLYYVASMQSCALPLLRSSALPSS